MPVDPARLLPPPVLFMICVFLGSVGERIAPLPLGPYDFGFGITIAIAAFAIAFGVAAWAIAEMSRHHTAIEPWRTPSRLVTTGPFRLTRNPLYLSLVLIVAGLAAATNSLWFALAACVLLVILDRRFVRREEEVIAREFGDEYDTYRAKVRRWL